MTFTQMKKTDGSSNEEDEAAPRGGHSEDHATHTASALGAPLDGGWGWVVTFASFSICVLVDGVCFSFGIFFDTFRTEFNSSKAATSWIGSVLNGSYMIVGPIVSALVNIYGCRRVAIVGAILSSTAFFCSTFTHSLGTLILTFGLLGGIGFGFMYLPAIIIVGYYFERRRALATGIACCGSGIGGFLFAPFCEYLLETYGWRGSIWILSALVLNGVLFALFFRPIPAPIMETVYSESLSSLQSESLSMKADEGPRLAGIPVIVKDDNDNTLHERVNGELAMTGTAPSLPTINVIEEPKDSFKKHEDFLKPSTGIYKSSSVILHGPGKLSDDDSTFRIDINRMSRSHEVLPTAGMDAVVKKKTKEHKRLDVPFLQRKDIFYSGSLWHLKEYQELGSLEEFRKHMTSTTTSPVYPSAVTSRGEVSQPGDVHVTTSKPSMKGALSGIFDFHLLKSPTFLVYCLACFLCMAGFFVPFIYMPNYALDLNMNKRSAAFLISIIGITNTVGRVAIGFISDQPWADSLQINNIALMLGGVVTLFVPYFKDYYSLAIYAAVFGSCIAVFVSLRSIIMVELMGLEKLTTSFGFVIMFQGLSSLVGSPIAGALSDYTGNYDAAFYMAGITLFLSGIICIPLRRIAHWEKAKMAAVALANQPNGNQPMPDDNQHTNNNNSSTRKRDGILSEEKVPMITVT